jgi:hypothetical protein
MSSYKKIDQKRVNRWIGKKAEHLTGKGRGIDCVGVLIMHLNITPLPYTTH